MSLGAAVSSMREKSTVACIVLADADPSVYETYCAPLAREQIDLVPAYSGIDCVQRLRDCSPDALVLDPDLPWGGGEGVLAVISGTTPWAGIPVMVLTAVRDVGLLNRLAHFAILDFQIKPCTPGRLADRIRRLLAPSRPSDASMTRAARLERVIVQRIGDRIRDLRVDAAPEQIVVHGTVCSHDVGKAAIDVVNDSLRRTETAPTRVEVKLDIVDPRS